MRARLQRPVVPRTVSWRRPAGGPKIPFGPARVVGFECQKTAYLAAYGREACSLMEGMPLRTRILTQRGWLRYYEVRVGDETVGYNLMTGHSEWTRVRRVVRYEPTPIVRYGNKFWSAEAAAGQRWLAEEIKTRQKYSPRPEHRLLERVEEPQPPRLVPFSDLKLRDRLVLARPASGGQGLPISPKEAALLGWIAGDGTVSVPREYWYSRPIHPGPGLRLDGSPRKGPGGRPASASGSLQRKWSPLTVSITQAKSDNFAAITAACSEDLHATTAVIRPQMGEWRAVHQWRLSSAYARSLMTRAGNPKTDAISQVLAMSAQQRGAWLDAIILAEGTRSGNRLCIYQKAGALADAIELAVYLSGRRPARSKDSRHGQVYWRIGDTAPMVGGPGRRSFSEPAGEQEVWCVTTKLGTWTVKQDQHVFLTGSSR